VPAGRPRLHLGDHARRLTTDELVPADSAPVSRLGRGRLRRATCGRSSPRVGHPTRRALPRFVGSPSAGSRVPAAGRALGPPHRSRVDRVGFCFGGAQSNLCATNPRPRPRRGDQLLRDARPGSRRLGDSNFPAPLRHAEEIAKPLLALYGGADELIPPQDIEPPPPPAASPTRSTSTPGHRTPSSTAPTRIRRELDRAWERVLDFLSKPEAPASA